LKHLFFKKLGEGNFISERDSNGLDPILPITTVKETFLFVDSFKCFQKFIAILLSKNEL